MQPLVGYRDDNFRGEGTTDPVAIAMYERKELGNVDIPLTLRKKGLIKNATLRDAIAYLNRKKREGYKNAIWICRKKNDVIRYYSYEDSPPEELTKYRFTDYIIISALGGQGDLVLYRGNPAMAMVPVRNRNLRLGRS